MFVSVRVTVTQEEPLLLTRPDEGSGEDGHSRTLNPNPNSLRSPTTFNYPVVDNKRRGVPSVPPSDRTGTTDPGGCLGTTQTQTQMRCVNV